MCKVNLIPYFVWKGIIFELLMKIFPLIYPFSLWPFPPSSRQAFYRENVELQVEKSLFCSSVAVVQLLSHVLLLEIERTIAHQAPLSSTISSVYSNSGPLSQGCYLTIASSAVPFSFMPSILPSIRVFSNNSALYIRWSEYWPATVLRMNIQGWFLLGLTGWISS